MGAACLEVRSTHRQEHEKLKPVVHWHRCKGLRVGHARCVYGMMGGQARGRLRVGNILHGILCDVVCGSLSGLLGWEEVA